MTTDINQLPTESESAFVCADCMDVMRRFPDGYFDIAITDPPYGISMGHTCGVGRGGTTDHSGGVLLKYQCMGRTQKHWQKQILSSVRRFRSAGRGIFRGTGASVKSANHMGR